jgi:polyisoprenoid-binding protein YceI
VSRSPYLAAIAPAVALAAGLVRWLLQGSGNVYTMTSRRAYVPDPDLGWRVVDGGPPWLGLELLGVVLGVLGAVVVGAWLVRRLERSRGGARRGLRIALWAPGVVTLAVPLWAFAGGFGPAGARDTLPNGVANGPAGAEITGTLDAPAGRWEVVQHSGTAITARVSAGGESFDARFAGDVQGAWQGDPGDLRAPMSAEVSVAVASVDTGVAMRSKSAREDYLQASKHPRLAFALDRILAAEPRGPGRVGFRAAGRMLVMGTPQVVDVTGELRLLDDAARARLGLGAEPAMIVEADTRLKISETPLAADAGDFDGNEIPVHGSFVLVHRNP